jgi:glyoxylase-like metal-dependent hydrolase (beta-lactamase superfamily II)
MEIIPNVHRVPGLKRANAYLLLGETVALVDTGLPGDADAILSTLSELGQSPADLTRIILTHHHADHTGSLARLRKKTGAQVLAHPADAPYISGETAQPLPSHPLIGLLFGLVGGRRRLEPIPVEVPLQDGDRLDSLEGATVVHMPGHTPGSIALHFPAERLLITGDAVIVRRGRPALPPRFFSQDPEQAAASIRRLVPLGAQTLCAGHGDPVVGAAAGQLQAIIEKLA